MKTIGRILYEVGCFAGTPAQALRMFHDSKGHDGIFYISKEVGNTKKGFSEISRVEISLSRIIELAAIEIGNLI